MAAPLPQRVDVILVGRSVAALGAASLLAVEHDVAVFVDAGRPAGTAYLDGRASALLDSLFGLGHLLLQVGWQVTPELVVGERETPVPTSLRGGPSFVVGRDALSRLFAPALEGVPIARVDEVTRTEEGVAWRRGDEQGTCRGLVVDLRWSALGHIEEQAWSGRVERPQLRRSQHGLLFAWPTSADAAAVGVAATDAAWADHAGDCRSAALAFAAELGLDAPADAVVRRTFPLDPDGALVEAAEADELHRAVLAARFAHLRLVSDWPAPLLGDLEQAVSGAISIDRSLTRKLRHAALTGQSLDPALTQDERRHLEAQEAAAPLTRAVNAGQLVAVLPGEPPTVFATSSPKLAAIPPDHLPATTGPLEAYRSSARDLWLEFIVEPAEPEAPETSGDLPVVPTDAPLSLYPGAWVVFQELSRTLVPIVYATAPRDGVVSHVVWLTPARVQALRQLPAFAADIEGLDDAEQFLRVAALAGIVGLPPDRAAEAWRLAGELEQALAAAETPEDLEALRQQHPRDPAVAYELGLAHRDAGKLAEALAVVSALGLRAGDPISERCLLLALSVLDEMGLHQDAVRVFAAARERGFESPELYLDGAIALRHVDVDVARGVLEVALLKAPLSSRAHAVAASLAGDPIEARLHAYAYLLFEDQDRRLLPQVVAAVYRERFGSAGPTHEPLAPVVRAVRDAVSEQPEALETLAAWPDLDGERAIFAALVDLPAVEGEPPWLDAVKKVGADLVGAGLDAVLLAPLAIAVDVGIQES